MSGRKFKESSIHNNIMLDCNRHRPNGYKDVTYGAQIGVEVIEDFGNKRNKDYDRS
jgi:hypothetical protein